jgi:hypothetical protein
MVDYDGALVAVKIEKQLHARTHGHSVLLAFTPYYVTVHWRCT